MDCMHAIHIDSLANKKCYQVFIVRSVDSTLNYKQNFTKLEFNSAKMAQYWIDQVGCN
jgi:hypothetical protein